MHEKVEKFHYRLLGFRVFKLTLLPKRGTKIFILFKKKYTQEEKINN